MRLLGLATLFQFQSAEFVLVAFFASTLALFLGGLHLALLGGALLGSTLCRGLLLACGGLTGVGALLCGGGLAQALGFGSGFGLLGLLLDLIQLVELASQYRYGEEREGRAQDNMLHVLPLNLLPARGSWRSAGCGSRC